MRQAPCAIATWNFGKTAVQVSGEALSNGSSALDAVERGINVIELDPNESSVGYGGLPNEQGIVELDAAIMDGTRLNAGSVAALQGIKTPISVARKVMEKTKHLMLVGNGATEFATKVGFQPENLLTEKSKAAWEAWKRENQRNPYWSHESHDTIGLVALDISGNIAAGCSTSGIAYKLPGRVGDSPIIGSGLYADSEVGGAAATGLGEEIAKFCSSFLVVEFMRNGYDPQSACELVIKRILERRPQAKEVGIGLIALDKQGRFGAASIRPGFPYAVWSAEFGVEMFQYVSSPSYSR